MYLSAIYRLKNFSFKMNFYFNYIFYLKIIYNILGNYIKNNTTPFKISIMYNTVMKCIMEICTLPSSDY